MKSYRQKSSSKCTGTNSSILFIIKPCNAVKRRIPWSTVHGNKSALLKGLALGFMLSIAVGPVIFSIIKQSLNHGHKRDFAFIASDLTNEVKGFDKGCLKCFIQTLTTFFIFYIYLLSLIYFSLHLVIHYIFS